MNETASIIEMWAVIGVGLTLSSIGIGGFTLLWRHIAAVEKRAEDRSAAVEKRAEDRSAAIEKRTEARFADLKADIHTLADRMDRNHVDVRHAIDTLVLSDQAKRLTILEEAVLARRGRRRPRAATLSHVTG